MKRSLRRKLNNLLTKDSFVSNKMKGSVSMHELNYTTDNYYEYIINNFCIERYKNNFNTVTSKIDLSVDISTLKKFIGSKCIAVETEDNTSVFVSKDKTFIVEITDKRWAISVKIIGDPDTVSVMTHSLNDKFSVNPCYIRWVYDEQYGDDITMPVNLQNLPVEEMYPFLGEETLNGYYDRFLKSTANILVLIGPPGTGKTTFLRGLLAHTKRSATLTYHPKILQQDSFFVDWLRSKDTFMILEDADTLLMPREDGNEMMSRFLNMGDGLMGFNDKKLIFSTNLPSTRDIDQALTRKGRCFDVLEFSALNKQQAIKVCDKMNLPMLDGEAFTVSELFAYTKNEMTHSKPKSFGFV